MRSNPPDPATIRNDRLDVPFSHLFVARGTVDLESAGALNEGDAVRLISVGGQIVTAVDDAEVLIWEMHASTG